METGTVFALASFVVACCARVGRLPAAGESLRAEALTMEAGGKGFNVAVGVHRLGATVDGLIALGNDFLGEFAERAILDAGLPRAMIRRYDRPTGSGIGLIDPQGENCIAVHPGANAALCAEAVGSVRGRVEGADAVVAQFEIEDGPIERAFAIARAAGVTTFLNPSPYRSLTPAIRANCDVLVVNRIEAARLAEDEAIGLAAIGDAPPDEVWARLAERLFADGLRALVVTDGARGAALFRPAKAVLRQAAFAVDAVDTVGAGDAFLAGLVATLSAGGGWRDAMIRASACGAIVAGESGVLAALPTAGQLDGLCTAFA